MRSISELNPIDALKIYALKTAPAFEAALVCGARLAGSIDSTQPPSSSSPATWASAFQILNDLKDWSGDADNKMQAGADILGGRPTLLLALALEALSEQEQDELLRLVSDQDDRPAEYRLQRARQLFTSVDVFEKAERLVDKHQDRAEAVADELEPDEFRRLLYYLIDTVLDRPQDVVAASEPILPLPIASPAAG